MGGCIFPGEPEDARELADVRHWRRVYEELLEGMEGFAAAPEVLERRLKVEARLLVWRQREVDLLTPIRRAARTGV